MQPHLQHAGVALKVNICEARLVVGQSDHTGHLALHA
jgi:hypothetical protein